MEGNTVAKIALQAATYAIDKPYDYQVPPELLDTCLLYTSPSPRDCS